MGLDSWTMSSHEDPNLVLTMNDGPCGVRKPEQNDFHNQSNIMIATCVPSPSSLAASFDKNICYENGKLLAKDSLSKKVDILLAPGVNIKRSALCGRNFEYWSEDPYLSGRLAAEYIKGLEDNNVCACIKHFCANNKEFGRTSYSSEISLRALNDIYLRSFSYALEYSNPSSIMTAYNKINGDYAPESEYLMQKKLKGEFNFKGIVMSDWGAVSNKGASIHNGMHLEMPNSTRSARHMDELLNQGFFTEEDLIRNDKEMYEFIKKHQKNGNTPQYNLDEGHKKAVEIANETPVLLKNENILPFKKDDKFLVLGWLSNQPRFVGGGSAWVNSYGKQSFIDVLKEKKIDFRYSRAYDDRLRVSLDKKQLEKFKEMGYDKAIFFLGTFQEDESEGSDRKSINVREEQMEALRILSSVFDNITSVIITGSVLNIEEIYQKSNAVLLTYLAGEGQAEATYNNLFGLHNPSGRLPETWISSLNQFPAYHNLLKHNSLHEYYDEDIYVGYRYFIEHQQGFVLPFGYGLSYSKFSHKDFDVKVENDEVVVNVTVTNESGCRGADIIEIYSSKLNSKVYRTKNEFREFEKIMLEPNESRCLTICIPKKHFGVYDYETDTLQVEKGEYEVCLGRDAFHMLYRKSVILDGKKLQEEKTPRKLERIEPPSKFTVDTPISILQFVDFNIIYNFFKEKGVDVSKMYEQIHWQCGSTMRAFLGVRNLQYDDMLEFIDYLNTLNLEYLLDVDQI